ncbi:DUF4198 domain-containing protein [Tepidicaulis sp. LMO-SS28]|uniref:DUF4198 domain-containing protein n=1 Tax=Tepidicaulis sp. LMO-SS28 TaxID=3447455 RepID=UPI003EDF74E1
MPRFQTLIRSFAAGAAALSLVSLAGPAEAHRMWLLPSATVLSGEDPWLIVDGAIANELFYFEYYALPLEGLAITAPDGTSAEPQNLTHVHYRSSFEVQLVQDGTYKVAVAQDAAFAKYMEDGETQYWRGMADEIESVLPAGAEELEVTHLERRFEVFATVGAPTETVFTPTGKGLEMVPVTHPNDLFAGEEATFKLLLDGEPAAGLDVEIVKGGSRYRDAAGGETVTADGEGVFSFTWPEAGMYWLGAETVDEKTGIPEAQKRNASYSATLEVLPQ